MGEVFEDICRQWLWQENTTKRLPIQFRDCGRWWGANLIRREEQEIDILAFYDDMHTAIFCECKWTNEKTDSHVLSGLMEKSEMFSFTDKYYMLFSRSGFKEDVKKKADGRIQLVDFGGM